MASAAPHGTLPERSDDVDAERKLAYIDGMLMAERLKEGGEGRVFWDVGRRLRKERRERRRGKGGVREGEGGSKDVMRER